MIFGYFILGYFFGVPLLLEIIHLFICKKARNGKICTHGNGTGGN